MDIHRELSVGRTNSERQELSLKRRIWWTVFVSYRILFRTVTCIQPCTSVCNSEYLFMDILMTNLYISLEHLTHAVVQSTFFKHYVDIE